MKRLTALLAVWATAAAYGGDVAVTVYNGNFACVREARELDLRKGENAMRLTDMSAQLEPDSVILRETGDDAFGVEILEQRYVNEPLTQDLMLRGMEGKEVRFRVEDKDGAAHEETGTLLRGPRREAGPVVQMADGVRFGLPGQPLFDGVDAAAFLKPSLEWRLWSGKEGKVPVEVAYLTRGLSWEATYNLVAPEDGGDEFSFSGWVGIRNDSGKDYPDAEIKLVAGDVAKLARQPAYRRKQYEMAIAADAAAALPEERAFDEFHLYVMPRRSTLESGELKQIEFLRADGVKGERKYVYEPLRDWRGRHANSDRAAGLNDEKKVAVRIEIPNSETNGLGVPLPKGKMRLYRRDAKDGRSEFTGEDAIDHTPKDEAVRLDNGYAFDLVAERKQTDFEINLAARRAAERFEIKVRNHKDAAVTVRVVEHLWRWTNWEINEESAPHRKTAYDRAEWDLEVPAGGETVLTYNVLYTLD
jgi:hypothetical protein